MKPCRDDRPVTCPFKKKGDSWATGEHSGVDYGCPTGDPVYAMWGGTITGKSWGSAYGTHQVIDHDTLPDGSPGYWAVYAHLQSKTKTSGRVEAGDLIGYSNNTGNSSGPHLHVEVQPQSYWVQGSYKDPQPWIDAGGESMSDYWYSGKPSGTLKVGTSYVNLDIEEWDPAKESIEHVLTYINCSSFKWAHGATSGRIRVRIDRGNDDFTGYQDYVVTPGQPEFLITHTYFEKGDGTRTWVGFKCMDGLQEMTIGTRYMKRYTL